MVRNSPHASRAGEWDHVAEDMMINFSESGHPVFSAFERRSLRSKVGGKLSVHCCGDTDAVEVVLHKIITFNRLSVHGAAADMCDEFASRILDCSESSVRVVADVKSETMVVPTDLSITTRPLLTNETVYGDLLRENERKIANLPDDLRFIRLCSNAGFMKIVAEGQYFVTQDDAELAKLDGSCREYTLLRDGQSSKVKGWTHGHTKIAVQYWR